MEADEIVKLICHRRATEDELRMAELVKRPASGRAAQFSQPSSAKSSAMATPRPGIQIQDPQSSAAAQVQSPSNPRPVGSAKSRPSSGVHDVGKPDTNVSEHCTSQYQFVFFWTLALIAAKLQIVVFKCLVISKLFLYVDLQWFRP